MLLVGLLSGYENAWQNGYWVEVTFQRFFQLFVKVLSLDCTNLVYDELLFAAGEQKGTHIREQRVERRQVDNGLAQLVAVVALKVYELHSLALSLCCMS